MVQSLVISQFVTDDSNCFIYEDFGKEDTSKLTSILVSLIREVMCLESWEDGDAMHETILCIKTHYLLCKLQICIFTQTILYFIVQETAYLLRSLLLSPFTSPVSSFVTRSIQAEVLFCTIVSHIQFDYNFTAYSNLCKLSNDALHIHLMSFTRML